MSTSSTRTRRTRRHPLRRPLRCAIALTAVFGVALTSACGDDAPPAPAVDASQLRGEPLALAPRAAGEQAPIVAATELLNGAASGVTNASSGASAGAATNSVASSSTASNSPASSSSGASTPASSAAAGANARNPNPAPAGLPIVDGPGGDEPQLPPRPRRDVKPPSDSDAAKVEADAKSGGESKISKDYKTVNFKEISAWSYVQPTAKQLEQDLAAVQASAKQRIPEAIWALDGKKIALEGFMSPIDFDKTGVKSFSLIHNAIGCCFGMFPKMNEWVFVEMAGDKKCDFFSVEPATIYGTFSVGEEIKDGYVVSLFRIKADHVFGTF